MGTKKNFVLDTNVILHDYKCIQNFEENDIYIPIVVLEELDHFKKGNEQINFNASEFTRELDLIANEDLFKKGAELGAQPIAPRRRAQGRLRAYPRAMVWWRMFVLVFSLVLAGPLPVTAASFDLGLSTASGETTEPCHHEVAADAGSPACCAGHDLATHCRSAACAAGCAQLPVDPASALPPEVPVGKLPRAELPLPRGRCVAPEEPPPTA